jgi:hypothetical protein
MYTAWDDNGKILAPLFASHFENLYSFVNQLLMKVDCDQTKPQALNKQHSIPSIPADAVSKGGNVD